MNAKKKTYKPRVTVPFNTGSRIHPDKKKFNRKEKHKKGFDNQP